MARTYEPIATQTVGTAIQTITFSSIPQTYTDLVISSAIQVSGNVNAWLRFNSDSGTNYSFSMLQGGSSAISGREANVGQIQLDSTAYPPFSGSAYGPGLTHIFNYSNSVTYTTVLTRANNTGSGISLICGLWRNTTAITSLSLIAGAVNFAVGSTFTLYGIKAA